MKKPRLLLHIGAFKTGTTALQYALATQREFLAAHGLLYHKWQDDGANMNHSYLAAELLSEAGSQAVESYFAELAQECGRLGAHTAIVSAEGFFALEFADLEHWGVRPALSREDFCRSREKYIQRLRDCIAGRFDPQVVVYLRRQDHFFNSLYNQLVKDIFAYTGTISDFAGAWGVLGDYALVLDLWARGFGAGRLVVRTYEKSRLAGGIVRDFFGGLIGLDHVPEPPTPMSPLNRSNLRLPRDFLEYKRMVNQRSSHLSLEQKLKLRDDILLLASRDQEPPGLQMLFSPAQRLALLARYETGNQQVAQRFLGASAPLFTEPMPPHDLPYEEYRGLSVEKAVAIGVGLDLIGRPPSQAPAPGANPPQPPAPAADDHPAPVTPAGAREPGCNLCQHPATRTLLYRVKGYEIVRCDQCGLVFVAPGALSATEIAGLYSQAYFEGGQPDGYTDYRASEETLRRQARRMLGRLRRYQPGGSLLELGCAYGFFLLEAREFFQVQGVELSAFAAGQARRRGLDVQAGDFRALNFPAGGYSAVCLFDCIEHLADPFAYLQKINSVLAPQGVVALTTGDIASLYARLSGQRWRLLTPPQHLFYFSRTTLVKLLEKTGFQVVEVSYPWKIVPWRLVLYQVSPRLKAALGPLGRLPLGLYLNLFDAMFVIARKT